MMRRLRRWFVSLSLLMAIVLGVGVAIYAFPPQGKRPAMIVSVHGPDPRNEFAASRIPV
jgi:hypothetical protein